MAEDNQSEFGLGLGKRSHAALVFCYLIFFSLIAGFGAGRMWEGTAPWRSAVASFAQRMTVYKEQMAAYSKARHDWSEAARTNLSHPKSSNIALHIITQGYPPLARRLGQEGDVLLDILVLPDGRVGDVRVERSSGFPQLDAAAMVGVGDWNYVPAMRDHRPVKAWTKANVRFRFKP